MSKSITILGSIAVAATLFISAALAFNPQPDPPGKRNQQTKSLGGPDTKSGKGGTAGEKAMMGPLGRPQNSK